MDSYPNKSLSQVANSLYTLEPIPGRTLQQLSFLKTNDGSCCIGLVNILYNITRQYPILNRQKESESIMVEEEKIQQPVQQGMNVNSLLNIRGQILKQYAKLLKKVLPEPAYSLARFQFEDFNKYCINRGLAYLMRHVRGIYPLIDTKKTPALQFLPFYEELVNNNSTLIGNQNWKFARKSVDAFYEQQIKTGKIFRSEAIDEQTNAASLSEPEYRVEAGSNQDSEQYERTGIRFCYIMLTGRHEEMQVIIAEAQKRTPQKDSDDLLKFNETMNNWRFWYDNYSKFMEEGIKMYESRKENNELPLVYGHKAGPEFTVIELIQQTLQLIKSKQPGRISAIKAEIERNISRLLKDAIEGNVVSAKSELGLYQARMLMLSYLHVIQKTLLQGDQNQNKVLSTFEDMNKNQIPAAEPFNRIFYNDQQLLSMYKTGKINRFPVVFNYGSEMLRKILKIITTNRESNLADNLIHLAIIDTVQRFSLLVKSTSIGDIHQIRKGSFDETAGEKILNFLESRKDEFKLVLVGKDGKKLMPIEANRHLTQFIEAWRQVYEFARNYSLNYFQKIKSKHKPANLIGTNQRSKNENEIQGESEDNSNQDTVFTTDLVYPMNRPDTIYRMLEVFMQNMSAKTSQYTRLLQEQTTAKEKNKMNQQIKTLKNQLISHVNAFREEYFKDMLSRADPSFTHGQPKISQPSLEKQNFLDFAWKTYASAFLLFSQFCKEIVDAPRKSEPDVSMKRVSAPIPFLSEDMEQRSEDDEEEEQEEMIDEGGVQLSSDKD